MKTGSFDFTAAPRRPKVGLPPPAVCSVPETAVVEDHKGWIDIATLSQSPTRVNGDESFSLNFTKIHYDYS